MGQTAAGRQSSYASQSREGKAGGVCWGRGQCPIPGCRVRARATFTPKAQGLSAPLQAWGLHQSHHLMEDALFHLGSGPLLPSLHLEASMMPVACGCSCWVVAFSSVSRMCREVCWLCSQSLEGGPGSFCRGRKGCWEGTGAHSMALLTTLPLLPPPEHNVVLING